MKIITFLATISILLIFLGNPQLVRAEDVFTKFIYTVTSTTCSNNDPSTNYITQPAAGVQCHATCNGINKSGTSDSNGKCVVSFPKSECDIGDQYQWPGRGSCPCNLQAESPGACYSWSNLPPLEEPLSVYSNEMYFEQNANQPANSVPEFSLITASLAGIGALSGYLLIKIRKTRS